MTIFQPLGFVTAAARIGTACESSVICATLSPPYVIPPEPPGRASCQATSVYLMVESPITHRTIGEILGPGGVYIHPESLRGDPPRARLMNFLGKGNHSVSAQVTAMELECSPTLIVSRRSPGHA